MKYLLSLLFIFQLLFSAKLGYMGSLFSEWFDITKRDNYIYGATSGGIKIMEINNSKLVLKKKYDIGDSLYKLILYENYIIAISKDTVYLFEYENNNLKLLHSYKLNINGYISDIVHKDNIFYVLINSYFDNSLVLKLENNKLIQVGELEKHIYYKGLIENNQLIASNYAGGYYIYDITDPLNPQLVTDKSIADGGAFSLFFKDNLLYTASEGGITVYNFPSFDVNFSIGFGKLPLDFYHLIVKNNYLLGIDGSVSTRFGIINLKDLNVSNPNVKYYEIGYDSKVKPYSWVDDNDTLYACVDNGIKKIELNDYQNVKIDTLSEIPIVKGMKIINGYAYIKDPQKVFIYKKEGDLNFTLVKEIEDKKEYGSINNLIFDKNYMYVIHDYAFCVYDITNPGKPLLISTYELKDNNGKLDTSHGNLFGGKIIDGKLYLSKDGDINILNIFDVSDPSNITLLGKLVKSGISAGNFEIIGNYLYMIVAGKYVIIIDISDPANPQFTGKYIDVGTILSMTSYNNKLIVSTYYNTNFYDVNLSTGELTLAHSYSGINTAFSMKVKDNYLYTFGKGFHIYNIKNLNSVYEITKENSYEGRGFVLDGNTVYLIKSMYEGRGIDVVNINNLIQKQTITFNKGWNLKSLPAYIEENVTDFGCKIYWKWDNVDKNWSYFTNVKEWDDILKKNYKKFNILHPSEGFWAECDDAHALDIKGVSYNTYLTNLTSGWNLIGVGKDVNISDLNLKENNIMILWIYKNNKWKYWVNDKNLSMLDENYTILKDDGVWVYKSK